MKTTSTPKITFRDSLIKATEAKLDIKFSGLPAVQRSRQMIIFFVQEVLEKLYPGLVPDDEDEVDSCIIDGAGDGGADFIYRNDEGQIMIIQAKYRNPDSQEAAAEVGRFCDYLERLYLSTKGKQDALHQLVIDFANQIDWEEDTFRMYYITTAKTGESVKDRVEQGLCALSDFPDLLEDRTEFYYLDNTLLNIQLRDAIESCDFSDKQIEIQMVPDANGNPWCHYEGDERDIYIGEVAGGVLANILQQHKTSLFTMNIREYVGDSKTNKQIMATALNDPTNFEYFNNGVTAVAGRITPDLKNRKLTCEKMSIINGAQTVKSLLNSTKKKSGAQHKPISSVKVLFRLMSFKYPGEVPFVDEVTKYNNTQNTLKIADFRSNDKVQIDIKRRFSVLNLNGKKYEYKNKRSEKRRNTIIVTLEEFTKSIFAFKSGPDDMFGGTSKMFDTSSMGLYTKVYEDPDCQLTDAEFNLLSGTYLACNYVKELRDSLRNSLRKEKETMHRSLEHKGVIYYAIGELLRESYKKQNTNLDHDLSRLAKPNAWLVDVNSNAVLALQKIFEIARAVLEQQYDLRAKAPSFKHRNWSRDEETLKDIQAGIKMSLVYGNPPLLWK